MGQVADAERRRARRERRHDAAHDDIVAASRAILAEDAELSLRAVATRMGITAPALYRYVVNYQELVDLVAFDIDQTTTRDLAAAAAALPPDDHAGRLTLMAVELRMWALGCPREFSLVFSHPVAATAHDRRALVTQTASGRLFTDEVHALWVARPFAVPAVDDLGPGAREAVLEPWIPVDRHRIAAADRGLVWVFLQAWAQLYGVVSLEVFGHVDPRVVQSGALFVDTLTWFAPRLGLGDEQERLAGLVRARLEAG